MSLFSRLLNPPEPPLAALWRRIAGEARDPVWYARHGVPDTLDGRFDMVALVTALVLLRLERDGAREEAVRLTERFVDDMEGSLREIGVGDLVVGKHVGKMVGALGGRLGAYREALGAPDRQAALAGAIGRNLFRGDPAGDAAGLAAAVLGLAERIARLPADRLREGRW